jgi:hypothetical protein
MARHLEQTCAALGALCAIAAAKPPSVHAAPGWTEPIDVAEGSHSGDDSADVAMDAKGDVVLVWVQQNGETSSVDAAWRPPGGTFSTPVTLSPPGLKVYSPVVAMDPEGDATIAWISGTGDLHLAVEVALRPAGGVFSTATELPNRNYVSDPLVMMDAKGGSTVAWVSDNGGFDEIEAASSPAGGVFDTPTTVSNYSFGSSTNPAIAMDPEGDTTLVWSQDEPIKKLSLIQMATQPVNANFGPATGFPLSASSPAVAMDSRGDTTVVWTGHVAEPPADTIETSTRTALGREFETPTILSRMPSPSEETTPIQPKVAMDAAGDTTVTWASPEGVRVATQSAGGPFGKPIELVRNPLVTESSPTVAMNDRGDGTVVWAQTGVDDSSNFLLGSTETPGGTFGAPTFISRGGALLTPEHFSSPITVAMDAQGDAVTAWVSTNSEKDFVQVAGYQAGGPQLEALQAPTEGQAGAPLAFSASPLSVWSTVVSTTWSWGDGSPDTSGTGVTHVFNAPGTYQVSVSATDALGNTTNATRTIIIHAPLTLNLNPTLTNNPKTSPTPPKSKLKAKEAVVSVFTPLFATRASTGGSSLGLLVGIPAVKGARAGDTIVVRCTAGCQRPVRMTIHVRKHHARDALTISPPLSVYRTTRIEIELLAPGHVARFVQYQFVRTGNTLIAHPTHRGCLSPAGRPRSCP